MAERGSFHRVLVLAPEVVARVLTGADRRDRIGQQALALALVVEAGLPVAVCRGRCRRWRTATAGAVC